MQRHCDPGSVVHRVGRYLHKHGWNCEGDQDVISLRGMSETTSCREDRSAAAPTNPGGVHADPQGRLTEQTRAGFN
jgi:hypothetical protein